MNDIGKHLALLQTKPFFEIEATNECNVNCEYCPRSNITRKIGVMDDVTFNSVIDKIPSGSKIMFAGMGEPLLNQDVDDFIKQTKKRKMIVGITTNGSLLTKRRLEKLIENNTDFLQISVPPNQNRWPHIISILLGFKEFTNHNTILQVSMVESDGLLDYSPIVSVAKDCGYKVLRKQKHSRGGNLYYPTSEKIHICGLFPKIVFVTWNGDVLSCCQDLSGSTKLGNLIHQKLSVIKQRKKMVIESNDWFDLCSYCDDEYRKLIFYDCSELE